MKKLYFNNAVSLDIRSEKRCHEGGRADDGSTLAAMRRKRSTKCALQTLKEGTGAG